MIKSFFAPARRTEKGKLQKQIVTISQSPILDSLMKVMSGVLVIVNEDRQIVALNQTFLKSFGIVDPQKALGLRLGETINCIHADEMEGGCGTSKSCTSCGAVIAMMASLSEDRNDEQICSIESLKDGLSSTMTLQVQTSPITIEGQSLIVVFVKDITREQIRANLERVFHHDMNNILTALSVPAELLLQDMPDRKEVLLLKEGAKRLTQEISLQRDLMNLVGNSAFGPEKREVTLGEINKNVGQLINERNAAEGKTIETLHECDDCILYTDKLLAGRVITNMLINALEATPEGGVVKFSTRRLKNSIFWEVWNSSWIPEQIQPRIFQRHFSTKPEVGRGVGTYSMKLFGEGYLQGSVQFNSSENDGTVFSFSLPTQG